ncbi:MAG: DNRLRE domain-containing protein, partial [Clostridia bacterium]|nr:DNRLRE domain-containing protein [Clostridia bacterium]
EAYGTMDVTEVKPGAMYIVSLAVDDTFLQGAEYPVTVDPTLTVPSAGITDVGLYQGAAATNKDSETDNYIGSSTRLGMGRAVFRANSLINSPILYTYMSSVVSAEFKLYINYARLTNQSLSIHQCTDYSWTETGATWNNCAADFESSAYDTVAVTGTGYVSFDITSAISRWRNNSNMLNGGLLVKNASESSGSNHLSYYSTENSSSNKPMIIVKYKTDMTDHFRTDVIMGVGDTVSLMKSTVYEDATVTYQSLNTSIATVSTSGVVTARTSGTVQIKITLDPNGAKQETYSTIEIDGYSSLMKTLNRNDLLESEEIVKTGDGFYMSTIPLSIILSRKGLSVTMAEYSTSYLYSVNQSGSSVDGLVGLVINDDASSKVSVSFIDFNGDSLSDCILNPTEANITALGESVLYTFNPNKSADDILVSYFSNTQKSGGYLIAEVYIEKIIEKKCLNNEIELVDGITNRMVSTVEVKDYSMLDAVNAYNSDGIFVPNQNKIIISDKNNLTFDEKNMVLLSHVGNTSFHSFAAEIMIHAHYVNDFIVGTFESDRVVIADMSISTYNGSTTSFGNKFVMGEINANIASFVEDHSGYTYIFGTTYRW